MGALAALSLDKGYRVSGSDVRNNQVIECLRARGADIFPGHASGNIEGADYVVFSSAISNDNPELIEAQKKQIPTMQRAKFLAELMQGYTGITVAGSHGKTTTASMIAHLLVYAGLQPTTAIGGIVVDTHSHAKLREGEYFVTEVDESDGSFLHFAPHYSVITNIDLEHIDYYHDWPNILRTYKEFIAKTVDGGIMVVYGDDERLLKLLKESGQTFKTYGFSEGNDVYAVNISFDRFESRFDVFVDGENLGTITLKVPGRHNVANALACVSLGLSLSISFDTIRDSFNEYRGVQRRFQLKGQVNGVWIIDDYAHHPTEIKTTLESAQLFKRSLYEELKEGEVNKVVAIFQPHRYSRIQGLFEDFAASLSHSDYLIVTDIYAASEQPIEGVTAQKLCEQIRLLTNKPVHYFPKEEIVDHVLSIVKPQDMVITLGAGDITRVAEDLVAALKSYLDVEDKVRL